MSNHDLIYLFTLLLLLGLPVTLALWWGDRVAEAWDRWKLRRRQGGRNRTPLPRTLPGREELLTTLRSAEDRCAAIDRQISERLLDLQRFTVNAWRQRRAGTTADLLKPAGVLTTLVPRKEEALHLLLDVACLQSDRIDAMVAEVEALSGAVGWDPAREAPPSGRPFPVAETNPADLLLRRIEEAARRRRTIDERLKQMKSWKPPQRPSSQPPPADAGSKGSRLDVTIQ